MTACASTPAKQQETVSTTTTQTARTPHAEHQCGKAGEGCPMAVPGTTLSAQDVAGGVALNFSTTGDVNDLRRRVHAMAEMRHCGCMEMNGGQEETCTSGHGGGGTTSPEGAGMISSTTTVEDTPVGARIIFLPKDSAQLTQLRQQVHAQAEQMSQGNCL